jgi:glutathione S-transferase
MFVPWFSIVGWLTMDEGFDWKKEYPTSHAWYEKITARPAVKKTLEQKQKAREEASH